MPVRSVGPITLNNARTPDLFGLPSDDNSLYAVAFIAISSAYYAQPPWLFIPFALSVIVLGLYYRSDMLAGIVIGASAAALSLYF